MRDIEAGFSVLEILVALAIASTAMLAVGGLFQLTMTVSSTITSNERVSKSLLQLQQLLRATDKEVGLAIAEASNEDVILTAMAEEPQARKLVLSLGNGQLRAVGARTVVADLSAFDAVQLEYLAEVNQRPAWSSTVIRLREVLGIRLRLTLGARTWRPLVWIASASDKRFRSMPVGAS
jgi:hypothetical protein